MGTALILAFATGASGNGAMKLWPLFGAVNQTLAALALIVITLYLKARGGLKWMVAGIPAIFMADNDPLGRQPSINSNSAGPTTCCCRVINIVIIIIAAWIVVEGFIKFFQTDEDTTAQR